MASLFLAKATGRWTVSVYLGRENGRIKARAKSFPTKDEALAYMAANNISGPQRRHQPRSEAEVIADLATGSALTDAGCMEWQGDLTNAGYGRFTWKPNGTYIRGAHRVAYHVLVAPVPADKVIDHLCSNRTCIRLDHLEVVTSQENSLRSPITLASLNAAKTHCAKGHEYTPENTYAYEGRAGRVCKTCKRLRAAARREQVTA